MTFISSTSRVHQVTSTLHSPLDRMTLVQEARKLAVDKYQWLLLLALALRLVLVVYGSIQDELFEVKYSDIDYAVVTDGARFVLDGGSPYERTTYRYTPLLAYAMIPNITLNPAFGKLLFVAFDMLTGWIVYALIGTLGLTTEDAKMGVLVWLWNPLSMTISTRGSGDSIICFLVLSTLLGLEKAERSPGSPKLFWLIFSALAHGLSVHWRLYPIIFVPSILLFLSTWPQRILFGLFSGGIFMVLGVVFYLLYGYDFLFETFLYHLSRTDHRHNFSVWFYALYLGLHANAGAIMSVASFLPQVLVQAAVVRRFATKDLAYCFLLQIWGFVVFNKVVTAQYFLWYVSLLPVTVSSMDIGVVQFLITLILPWLITEVHWLAWGYRIEFLGKSSFEGIHAASVLFFLVNVYILVSLVRLHRPALSYAQSSRAKKDE